MASGIILPSLLSIATSVSEGLIFGADTFPPESEFEVITEGPWTPPQYSQPALTILTVPSTVNNNGVTTQSEINYVFDAVFKIIHNRRVRKTSHPVLTGANITDHAYSEPSRVTLEIGMSDCMASFQDGIWVGAATKSISAWQILKNLAINKVLVTLTTRLDNYQNMLIVDLNTCDENRTKYGLRATVYMEELLSASVLSIPAQSSRPQTSGSTTVGTVQGTSIDPIQGDQHVIPSSLYPDIPTFPTVPGAGDISSNSLSQSIGIGTQQPFSA